MDTLLGEIENVFTSKTVTHNSNKKLVHTVTASTDESHAGTVQSTCLKTSMYKQFSVNMVRRMFRTQGGRIASTGSNGIPTQHEEQHPRPGNNLATVLRIQMARLRHPMGTLSLVYLCV